MTKSRPEQADQGPHQGPHQGQPILQTGLPLNAARTAMILIHGRGASAADILSLAPYIARPDMTVMAPQASGSVWYPYSFLEPISRNEPGLSSGLALIDELIAQIAAAGIPYERLVLGGFSQGACLASEYVARHPRRYGALLVFSGGLIGPIGMARSYAGSLAGTPIFVGCSDVDFHIPLERVQETSRILQGMGGEVTERIYPNMDHTIIQDELDYAAALLAAIDPQRANT